MDRPDKAKWDFVEPSTRKTNSAIGYHNDRHNNPTKPFTGQPLPPISWKRSIVARLDNGQSA